MDQVETIEILPQVITDGSTKVSQKSWSRVIPPKKLQANTHEKQRQLSNIY